MRGDKRVLSLFTTSVASSKTTKTQGSLPKRTKQRHYKVYDDDARFIAALFQFPLKQTQAAIRNGIRSQKETAAERTTYLTIPIRKTHRYLETLVGLGHRVALYEDKRLQKIIQPASFFGSCILVRATTTATTAEASDGEQASQIEKRKKKVTIAYADMVTHQLYTFADTAAEDGALASLRFASIVTALQPREIVLAESSEDRAGASTETTEKQEWPKEALVTHIRSSDDAVQVLKTYLQTHYTLSVDVSNVDKEVEGDAEEAVSVIERDVRQCAAEESMWWATQVPIVLRAASTCLIDPLSIVGLDILKNAATGQMNGSLRHAIDSTVTSGGARLLRQRLMAPAAQLDTAQKQLAYTQSLLPFRWQSATAKRYLQVFDRIEMDIVTRPAHARGKWRWCQRIASVLKAHLALSDLTTSHLTLPNGPLPYLADTALVLNRVDKVHEAISAVDEQQSGTNMDNAGPESIAFDISPGEDAVLQELTDQKDALLAEKEGPLKAALLHQLGDSFRGSIRFETTLPSLSTTTRPTFTPVVLLKGARGGSKAWLTSLSANTSSTKEAAPAFQPLQKPTTTTWSGTWRAWTTLAYAIAELDKALRDRKLILLDAIYQEVLTYVERCFTPSFLEAYATFDLHLSFAERVWVDRWTLPTLTDTPVMDVRQLGHPILWLQQMQQRAAAQDPGSIPFLPEDRTMNGRPDSISMTTSGLSLGEAWLLKKLAERKQSALSSQKAVSASRGSSSSSSVSEYSKRADAEMMDTFDVIKNDVSLDGRVAIITGPNMGGKSTYLRAIGHCQILSQIGCPIPADDGATLGIADRIVARIGARDDLSNDVSTFLFEASHLLSFLRPYQGVTLDSDSAIDGSIALSPNTVLLIDEMGRGTNAREGISFARGVLTYLAALQKENRTAQRCFVVTHLYQAIPTLPDGSIPLSYTLLTAHAAHAANQYRLSVVKDAHLPGWQERAHRTETESAESGYGLQTAATVGLPPSILTAAREIRQSLLKTFSFWV